MNKLYSSPADFKKQVMGTLTKVGIPLNQEDDFNFYFYLKDKPTANICAKNISAQGFEVTVRPGATGRDWLCLASKRLTPRTAPWVEIGGFFLGLEAKHAGEFDGWEIQPKPMNLPDGLLARLVDKLKAMKEESPAPKKKRKKA